nr:VWA domain-containing protein [Synechococcus sp. CCY 9618]
MVIDRSGSMHGRKISFARKAARFLAGELSTRDHLAIISFDDQVDLVVPSRAVGDPQPFLAAINRIVSGGSTALSDGQANAGLTDSRAIADRVSGLTQHGVRTSAFGLGVDFDEDLMGSIAAADDGTLAHIESPQVLSDLHASELRGAGDHGRPAGEHRGRTPAPSRLESQPGAAQRAAGLGRIGWGRTPELQGAPAAAGAGRRRGSGAGGRG